MAGRVIVGEMLLNKKYSKCIFTEEFVWRRETFRLDKRMDAGQCPGQLTVDRSRLSKSAPVKTMKRGI